MFLKVVKPGLRLHSIAHTHQKVPQMGEVYGIELRKL